jgi:hypothetical protein
MKFRAIFSSNPLYRYGWIPITRWSGDGWLHFDPPGNEVMICLFHKTDNRIGIMTEANVVDEVLNKYLPDLVGPRREPTQ